MSIRAMVWAWEQDTSATETLVLLALANCADEDGDCWPSMRYLTAHTKLTPRCIQLCIRRLENEGCVVTTPRCDDSGRSRSNIYRLRMDGGGRVNVMHPGVNVMHREGEPHAPSRVNVMHPLKRHVEPSDEPRTCAQTASDGAASPPVPTPPTPADTPDTPPDVGASGTSGTPHTPTPHATSDTGQQIAAAASLLHQRIVEAVGFNKASGATRGPDVDTLTGLLRAQHEHGYTLADIWRCVKRGGVNPVLCAQWNDAARTIGAWFERCASACTPSVSEGARVASEDNPYDRRNIERAKRERAARLDIEQYGPPEPPPRRLEPAAIPPARTGP